MDDNKFNGKIIRELTDGYHGPDDDKSRLDYLKNLIEAYKRYLPARVIEKIKVDPYSKRIDGERRNITVVFADLSGFTALSETMDAEDIAGVINEFFTRMVRIVHKYGGSVDKFLGDALMVLFGAPVAHYDDPERAVRASLEMQQEMARFNREKSFASPLAMSIGINTGPAVALNVGGEDRMEYTVIGDTVNLAARLEGVSKAGETIISNFTHEHITDIAEVVKMPSVRVKGKKKPVINYLVKSIQERRSVQVSVKTKLVGRREELGKIKSALIHAAEKKLCVMPVIGDPGGGKTRLGMEAESMAMALGFKVLTARCMPYESDTPYRAITGLLNVLYSIKPSASEEERRTLVGLALKNRGLALDDTLPYIGILTGFGHDQTKNEIPEEIKKKMFKALAAIIEKEAGHNKVFIRIEDFQWSDPTSIEFLDHFLMTIPAGTPILFLFECRSDYNFPWLNHGACSALVLDNLSPEETSEFCRVALQGECIPEAVSALVYDKSSGNPLFAAEIIRLLLKKGGLRRTADGYITTERFKAIEIAESISSLILDRIDRMSELDRRILQYASVIGKTFDRGLLATIVRIPDDELRPCLDKLQHLEGLVMRGAGDDAYEFSASTTCDVVYSSLLRKRRKELHLQIGAEIERIHPEDLDGHLEELAYHYSRSADERKGVRFLKAAADKTYRLYALKETGSFFDIALELLRKKELSIDEKKDLLEVLRRHGWILKLSGKLRDALVSTKRSLKVAREIESPVDEGMAANNIGIIYHELGVPRKGLVYWKRALAIGNRIGDGGLQVQSINNLGHVYLQSGRLAKALEHYTRALELGNKLNSQKDIAFAQLNIGGVHERTGDFAKAVEFYRKAAVSFETIGDKGDVANCINMIGAAQMHSGNLDDALKNFEQSALTAGKAGNLLTEGAALGNIGLIYAQRWELEKALVLFERSVGLAQTAGQPSQIMTGNINIGDVHLYQGNLKLAMQRHHEALEISREIQDPLNEGMIRRSLGWENFYAGAFNDAAHEYQESHDLFMKINDRRDAVISLLGRHAVACHLGPDDATYHAVAEIARRAVERNDVEIHVMALDIFADYALHGHIKGPPGAAALIDQLLQACRSIGQKRLYAWTLANKALLQLAGEQFSECASSIEDLRSMNASLRDKGLDALTAIIESGSCLHRDNPDDAIAILSPASDLLAAYGQRVLLLLLWRVLQFAHGMTGDEGKTERCGKEARRAFDFIASPLDKTKKRSFDGRIVRITSWITGGLRADP